MLKSGSLYDKGRGAIQRSGPCPRCSRKRLRACVFPREAWVAANKREAASTPTTSETSSGTESADPQSGHGLVAGEGSPQEPEIPSRNAGVRKSASPRKAVGRNPRLADVPSRDDGVTKQLDAEKSVRRRPRMADGPSRNDNVTKQRDGREGGPQEAAGG